MRTRFAVAAFLAMFVLVLPMASAADLVVVDTPKGKRQVMCTILEETYRYILVESNGKKQKLYTAPKYAEDPSEVKTVVREVEHGQGQFPSTYSRAEMDRRNREYEAAFEKYKEAANEVTEETRWVAPYIWYYAGEAAFKEAKYARVHEDEKKEWYRQAADRYKKLVTAVEDHYFTPNAKIGLVQAQIRLEDFADAGQSLQDILDSDYPEEVKTQAKVWEARLLVERGQHEEALEKLQALREQLMGEDPQLAYLAMISEAYAWQGKKEYARAEELFQQVGLRSPEDEMRAEAYNSRGLSLKRRGQAREALFSFLRVVVLHRPIMHEYQKALYYAAITSHEYYSEAPKRARELGTRLTRKYPNSYWAKSLKKQHPDLAG